MSENNQKMLELDDKIKSLLKDFIEEANLDEETAKDLYRKYQNFPDIKDRESFYFKCFNAFEQSQENSNFINTYSTNEKIIKDYIDLEVAGDIFLEQKTQQAKHDLENEEMKLKGITSQGLLQEYSLKRRNMQPGEVLKLGDLINSPSGVGQVQSPTTFANTSSLANETNNTIKPVSPIPIPSIQNQYISPASSNVLANQSDIPPVIPENTQSFSQKSMNRISENSIIRPPKS